MPACLMLTAAPVASQGDLTTLLAAQGLSDAAPLALATSSGTLAAGALPAAAYDAVVSVAQAPGHHTVALLGLLGAALKPGGKLVVQEVGAGGSKLTGAGLVPAGMPDCGCATHASMLRCLPCFYEPLPSSPTSLPPLPLHPTAWFHRRSAAEGAAAERVPRSDRRPGRRRGRHQALLGHRSQGSHRSQAPQPAAAAAGGCYVDAGGRRCVSKRLQGGGREL